MRSRSRRRRPPRRRPPRPPSRRSRRTRRRSRPDPQSTIPPASDDGTGATTPEIADWPAGKDAWTIVLESSSTEEAATARAQELIEQGVPVGLLSSDEYPSLEPGRWVVFSGQYDSQRAADQGLTDLSDQVEGAYVRRVSPTQSGAATTP